MHMQSYTITCEHEYIYIHIHVYTYVPILPEILPSLSILHNNKDNAISMIKMMTRMTMKAINHGKQPVMAIILIAKH